MVGAELGPVIAARQPILIGSDWAMADLGHENVAAPSAPALPNRTSRREKAIKSSDFIPGARRCRGRSCSRSAAMATTGLLGSNLSLMRTPCPELPVDRHDIAGTRPHPRRDFV
jgi:hypothetical protein